MLTATTCIVCQQRCAEGDRWWEYTLAEPIAGPWHKACAPIGQPIIRIGDTHGILAPRPNPNRTGGNCPR
jgi:hypothetical protein